MSEINNVKVVVYHPLIEAMDKKYDRYSGKVTPIIRRGELDPLLQTIHRQIGRSIKDFVSNISQMDP
jgi:hypothetical protein